LMLKQTQPISYWIKISIFIMLTLERAGSGGSISTYFLPVQFRLKE
jgi:hypothetical protein